MLGIDSLARWVSGVMDEWFGVRVALLGRSIGWLGKYSLGQSRVSVGGVFGALFVCLFFGVGSNVKR